MAEDTPTTGVSYVSKDDDSQIEWKDFTSPKGTKYRVGYPKSSDSAVAEGNH